MLLQLTALVLVFYTSHVHGQQQCSYVTVPICGDDVTVTPGSLMSGRAEKGAAGPPGKMGPRGLPGKTGEKGAVGQKGEALNLEDFNQELRIIKQKLQEIESAQTMPNSCWTSPVNGYQRFINNNQEAVCEDGWNVFQRRFNGSVDFDRNWQEYKDGFGNMRGEFWLGLDKLHHLTSGGSCRLHVKLVAFDGSQVFAQYSSFAVGNESDNYRLHVSGYSGTSRDSLTYHNGMQFTTKDRDNDKYSSDNCAVHHGVSGGWWFKACIDSALNAKWGRSRSGLRNMIWFDWRGGEAVKESTMKIRCD